MLTVDEKLREEILAVVTEPSLASQLPIIFKSGAHWDAIAHDCPNCKQPIPQDGLRGRIRPLLDDTYSVDGASFCSNCKTAHRIIMRFYPDLRVMQYLGGKWHVRQYRGYVPFHRLVRRLLQKGVRWLFSKG